MNEREFEALLDRHGPSFEDWPDVERIAAAELLPRSPQAQAALSSAESLARQLAELTHSAPAGLSRRILAATAAAPQRTDPLSEFAGWFSASLWRPAAAMAAPLLFGFLLGLNAETASEDDLSYASVDPWMDSTAYLLDE